jgi:K(+)-stimulated pyrophosphate-energized sodium pump
MAVTAPVLIGFAGGPEMLGGLLAGVTTTGVLMAIFQSNAGGAWDNAKKMFEEGVEIDGVKYYKGSEPHKAAVVGDTVGDPFKDTSGPSLNILIKLMSVVALVIAPSIAINTVDTTLIVPEEEKILNIENTLEYFEKVEDSSHSTNVELVSYSDRPDIIFPDKQQYINIGIIEYDSGQQSTR